MTATRAKLLTLQQAHAEFGVPYGSLRDMIIRGDLARVDMGTKRLWIKRADIEALIEQRTTRGLA